MTWEKIVEVVAVSACPKCGNGGFHPEPGFEEDDPEAILRYAKCGHTCPANEFMRPVDQSKPTSKQ